MYVKIACKVLGKPTEDLILDYNNAYGIQSSISNSPHWLCNQKDELVKIINTPYYID